MAIMAKNLLLVGSTNLLFVALLLLNLHPTEAQLGVCYGMKANNLPSKQDVVNLYQSNGIKAMRIYDPDQPTLEALQGSGISLILGVPNDKLQSLGSDQSAANQWVQTNVAPYASSIKYIAVGNEVLPSDEAAPSVGPALQNVLNALNSAQLGGYQIKVSTAIKMSLIANSYPPSSGTFSEMSFMSPIVNFLKDNGFPLLVNVYTYFAYVEDKKDNPLDYALGSPGSVSVVTDYNNGLQYRRLFDAQVDSVYAALQKAGAPDVHVVVSETGWPSDGGDSATVANAQAYYSNTINRVHQGLGTPLKPGEPVETYLFAMFDEYQKTGAETERHFGLFSPNKQPKYQLSF